MGRSTDINVSEHFTDVPAWVEVSHDAEPGILFHIYLLKPVRRLMSTRNQNDIQEYLTSGQCKQDAERLRKIGEPRTT